MAAPTIPDASSAQMLTTLILCALLGLVGQGTRAAVTLKGVAAFDSGKPGAQSGFNAAYFAMSMMIGAIAGILAGLGLGVDKLLSVDPTNIKLLLGIAVAGYAGVDFIENTVTKFFPGGDSPQAAAQPTPGATRPTDIARSAPSGIVAPASPPLKEALAIVVPAVKPDDWVPALQAAFSRFALTTNRRMAAAIGQFVVEAGAGFTSTVEDLDYTHADVLADTFKNAFATAADAQPYVGKPVDLGNFVYANSLGNGDVASGDGFRFRGRGLIQITGRETYTAFAKAVGKTPDQAAAYCETPEGAAVSGCWFLATHDCLPLADRWALSDLTRAVNGPAMRGNAQRIAYANDMLKALGG